MGAVLHSIFHSSSTVYIPPKSGHPIGRFFSRRSFNRFLHPVSCQRSLPCPLSPQARLGSLFWITILQGPHHAYTGSFNVHLLPLALAPRRQGLPCYTHCSVACHSGYLLDVEEVARSLYKDEFPGGLASWKTPVRGPITSSALSPWCLLWIRDTCGGTGT